VRCRNSTRARRRLESRIADAPCLHRLPSADDSDRLRPKLVIRRPARISVWLVLANSARSNVAHTLTELPTDATGPDE